MIYAPLSPKYAEYYEMAKLANTARARAEANRDRILGQKENLGRMSQRIQNLNNKTNTAVRKAADNLSSAVGGLAGNTTKDRLKQKGQDVKKAVGKATAPYRQSIQQRATSPATQARNEAHRDRILAYGQKKAPASKAPVAKKPGTFTPQNLMSETARKRNEAHRDRILARGRAKTTRSGTTARR